jgi:hypothetical protein
MGSDGQLTAIQCGIAESVDAIIRDYLQGNEIAPGLQISAFALAIFIL